MTENDNHADLLGLMNGESDEAAWTAIAERYRGLLIVWAMRCSATAASGESAEAIADQALTRAWLALSSKGFGSFPNLAALLAYLRMCVTHVAIDAARARAAQARHAQWLTISDNRGSEETVLEELERAELWQCVNELVRNEQERVVLFERFVLDLPPRIIQRRHPALFADTPAVYRALRNVCDRLQRRSELQLLWSERFAA